MIKTQGLTKIYTTEEVETTALNNINLEIKEGEYVAVMGPSGCGKSTLLNVLGMIDSIQSAPHLSFTIYMIELNTYIYDDSHFTVEPRVISRTNEVERSVICAEIAPESLKYKLESQTPSPKRSLNNKFTF